MTVNVSTTDTTNYVVHNGPVCNICSVPYIGQHTCRDEDIQARIDWLKSKMGQPKYPSFVDICPCNRKNGGSGVCNCIMGGPRITC